MYSQVMFVSMFISYYILQQLLILISSLCVLSQTNKNNLVNLPIFFQVTEEGEAKKEDEEINKATSLEILEFLE